MNRSNRHVVIDVETTGFSPQRGARIIEIGAVLVENGRMVSEFQSLINCGRAVSRQAQMVHGISDRMLFGQPAPEDVFPRFYRYISGCTIVAHNAAFDISFLRHEFSRLGLGMPNGYFCTMKMSRRCYPMLLNHKLDTVAKHVLGGLPPGIHRHRALDDAKMTAMIWMEMMKR
ncbi:MAG: DNA polymerase III subunit epsilon [Desulfobacteraceae bacterium A6]|jgi:DNA polymerase-3 subunit epsilon|nr:MAG: DNA polymerase III subunit epsilon [Desulfobacteraceae bacterium A6]